MEWADTGCSHYSLRGIARGLLSASRTLLVWKLLGFGVLLRLAGHWLAARGWLKRGSWCTCLSSCQVILALSGTAASPLEPCVSLLSRSLGVKYHRTKSSVTEASSKAWQWQMITAACHLSASCSLPSLSGISSVLRSHFGLSSGKKKDSLPLLMLSVSQKFFPHSQDSVFCLFLTQVHHEVPPFYLRGSASSLSSQRLPQWVPAASTWTWTPRAGVLINSSLMVF